MEFANTINSTLVKPLPLLSKDTLLKDDLTRKVWSADRKTRESRLILPSKALNCLDRIESELRWKQTTAKATNILQIMTDDPLFKPSTWFCSHSNNLITLNKRYRAAATAAAATAAAAAFIALWKCSSKIATLRVTISIRNIWRHSVSDGGDCHFPT